MDASSTAANEFGYATGKISGEDGLFSKDSKHRATGTPNTLGYGAIIEGREGACIMANVLASSLALLEVGSFDQGASESLPESPLSSPPSCDALRIIIQFAYFRNGPIFYTGEYGDAIAASGVRELNKQTNTPRGHQF